jgi:replication fork protection complex subunit Tof1/Swi1
MSSSELADPTLREASDILQQQLVYNGEVLDIALDSLKHYRPGTQSLAYLDSSVHLAYALLRMLESWSKKGNETYVRQKVAKKRRKSKGGCSLGNKVNPPLISSPATPEEEGIPDVEVDDSDDDVINETLFTFEAFESVSQS